MPVKNEKQRRFFYAELSRAIKSKKRRTKMSISQLKEWLGGGDIEKKARANAIRKFAKK